MSPSTIEVRVRELDQLFDTMDPSPFHEQDLARSAEEYIVDSVKELHAKPPLELRIHVDQPAPTLEEQTVERAIGAHFARRSVHLRRALRDLLGDGLVSLAIGVIFFAASFMVAETLSRMLGANRWSPLAKESLLIGGWVAMWRPLQIFLYDWWPIVRERRLHDRLSRMTVRIVRASAR